MVIFIYNNVPKNVPLKILVDRSAMGCVPTSTLVEFLGSETKILMGTFFGTPCTTYVVCAMSTYYIFVLHQDASMINCCWHKIFGQPFWCWEKRKEETVVSIGEQAVFSDSECIAHKMILSDNIFCIIYIDEQRNSRIGALIEKQITLTRKGLLIRI